MSAPIRVAIRADSGNAIGAGHFARSAAIADALSASPVTEVLLVCNAEGAALVPAYFSPQTTVLALGADEVGPQLALRRMRSMGWTPDVVCLDQYGSVPDWEALAAENDIRLLVFDDLDAARSAELIVRLHGGTDPMLNGVVLRGPSFVPLSRHVIDSAGKSLRRAGRRPRLNVCFGGSDPTGETDKILRAATNLEQLDVDVVVGPGARLDPQLAGAVRSLSHVRLHRAPSQADLAELVAAADLALGAGGVMLWERLYLGVPSLVVATAENQLAQIDKVVAAGAVRFLGDHSGVTAEDLVAAIADLAADEVARALLSERGRTLVDGRGALRLAAWLRALALEVREVEAGDADDLLRWRTDDRNWQHNWNGSEKPTLAEHTEWLAAKLADPDCVFRLVSWGADPIGVVRFDIDDDGVSAYLSIYLVPGWHERGMGLAVYCAAERALRRSRQRVARIVSRIDGANSASERVHRDAGFDVRPSNDRFGWLDATKLLD
jgi:UDP-2,4-diacetamido-2,4,6-trideoxy-beta-L-altropyranose hydrolase